MKKILLLLISIALLGAPGLYAVGDKPDKAPPAQEENDLDFSQEIESVDDISIQSDRPTLSAPQSQGRVILTEEMQDTSDKFDKYMKQRQYDKAREQLLLLPTEALTEKQKKTKKTLNTFSKIKEDNEENIRQFGKDESLDASTQRTVKRLQRSGKENILLEKNNLARDILIQSLYLDRKNYESKQLLERCLDLPLGQYKVENIESKYWKESLVFLRSGYPAKSIESLEVLINFDPENADISQRLGSAYYLSGEVKKAIAAWKRALYLNPKDKNLQTFIKNAEVELKRQDAEVKAFLNKKKAKKETVAEDVEMQVLRKVNDSNTAYSYAQEVRQQMKGIQVIVEEDDDGKWVVKIPRAKKKTKKEKK
ncbi:hypothetical protein DID78_03765 [Candidatus Marinamargulisbacteria bacterium SCGC AG-343-D04]|nr:hypothetical protein DID78_03765 [Candidatus Marinamargulisbacteria bacterium SCGC AG-343-D04]